MKIVRGSCKTANQRLAPVLQEQSLKKAYFEPVGRETAKPLAKPLTSWLVCGFCKKLVIFSILLFAFSGCFQTERVYKENLILIDVREIEEFASGHISGAVNIPLSELAGAVSLFHPEDVIAVYCRTGVRSSAAKNALHEAGFVNVIDLGGINNARRLLED